MSSETERQEADPLDDFDRWLQEQQRTLDGVLDVEAGLKEILSPDRD